jgi:hypothetical protein
MIDLIIGAIAVGILWLLANRCRKEGRKLSVAQWTITIVEVIYIVFVIELVIGFLSENSPRGALVMGLITGTLAVIGAVLIARFIFLKPLVK